MRKIDEYHIPVLLKEAIELLNIRPGTRFIDATLGGGGHSEAIVQKGGILLGIDQDPEAIKYATVRLSKACPPPYPAVGGNYYILPKVAQGNFSDIDILAKENELERVDGILFDLGVSSHQLEEEERGFSFNQNGELDMRMNPNFSVSAKDLIKVLSEHELDELFYKFGGENHSKRFAKAICRAREIKPIETCNELAKIIMLSAPPRGKFDRTHPATRVFQALRIAVNDELNSLKTALPKAIDLLNKGGRLVVISFHSLEDGIVKKFFIEKANQGILKIINEKPIVPIEDEVRTNPRSRSAKLRVAEKL